MNPLTRQRPLVNAAKFHSSKYGDKLVSYFCFQISVISVCSTVMKLGPGGVVCIRIMRPYMHYQTEPAKIVAVFIRELLTVGDT